MRVFLTGGTGCVGAHTALALLEAGHSLRLYVRNRDAAARYFAAYGYALDDIAVGDIRDARAVREAMRGCTAVLHAAAMVSLEAKKAKEILENNHGGTVSVIGAACELGTRSILYVSSLEVFSQRGAGTVTEDSPLSDSAAAYSKSKRDSELYVRALQREGWPIQIVYPAGVIGPGDPKLSESNRAITTLLDGVPITSSGMQCVDARDLAQAHRWLIEHPPAGGYKQARYVVGGHYYPWAELHRMLERVTSRRIPSPRVPGGLLRFLGHAVDAVKVVVPMTTQISADAMTIATQWTPADSQRFTSVSGLRFRPGDQTFTDAIRWLVRAGHLPASRAGWLAAG